MENSNSHNVPDKEQNTKNTGNDPDRDQEDNKAMRLMVYYDMYEDGHFCDCKHYGTWDRIYSDNNKFMGYKLQHVRQCIGRVKLAELIKEVKNDE